MGVADNLEKAAVLIATGGHCKGTYVSGDCHCLLGAINRVVFGHSMLGPETPTMEAVVLAGHLGWPGPNRADPDYIEDLEQEAHDAGAFITRTNDGATYCQEQAVADLNAAAKLARGE